MRPFPPRGCLGCPSSPACPHHWLWADPRHLHILVFHRDRGKMGARLPPQGQAGFPFPFLLAVRAGQRRWEWRARGILGSPRPAAPGAVRCRRRPREGSTAPSFPGRRGDNPSRESLWNWDCSDKSHLRPLSALRAAFFGRVFSRGPRGIVPVAPHCRVCHKYLRHPAGTQLVAQPHSSGTPVLDSGCPFSSLSPLLASHCSPMVWGYPLTTDSPHLPH